MAMIVVLALPMLALFWAVGAYNRLVSLRNQFRNAFAQIDVQLKRRYDLIPNLVETAKTYMQHERQTLEAVIAARNQAASANARAAGNPANADAIQQMAAAEGMLASSLGKMFALSEAYPELKANQNMMQLTEELSSTENRIAFARQAYNDGVMQYNISLEQFPGSFIASMFSFKPAELLQATEAPEERKAVKVSF
ncbi:LemA family protein [Noviherbaspirillum massiliense]|uniref:LemA family protein n=1 Tax=Noviherbaspirillum massiliense TaxID=1465823 RepID=UPI000375985E|nr:LemA family protein [Noviherbaspirillum massiliense]